jgi:hypothetical protein
MDCLGDGPAGNSPEEVSECATSATYDATVGKIDGPPPTLLVDFNSKQRCFETVSFIAWFDSDGKHVQSAEPFLYDDPGSYLGSGFQIPEKAVFPEVITENGETFLGIPHLEAACGSGLYFRFLFLHLKDGQWVKVWDSDETETKLSDTVVEYLDGIDRLLIRGNSWMREDDRRDFHEANAGPHRLFEQVWVREGATYVLESETLIKTPYARLVDFVYGLSHQATYALQDMVTDPALIEAAYDLGLAQDPIGQEWIGLCGDGAPEAPPPCRVEVPGGATVTIEMTDADGNWLISAITPQ